MTKTATIRVPSLKVTVPLAAAALPRDLVPMDGPAGEPTIAVRGNVDRAAWAQSLPLTEIVEVGEVRIYVLHDVSDLDVDPKAAELSAVVSGHSHRPSAEVRDGVLFLNPGSAGPRRFSLPVTIAKLRVVGKSLSHELIELAV